MEYYTIKQLADEFNVSVQAIHKELKKEKYQSFIEKKNINSHSTLVVNQQGLNKLNQHFNKLNQPKGKLIKPKSNSSNSDYSKHGLNKLNQVESTKINQFKQVESTSLIKQLKENNEALKHTIAILENETKQLHTELQHEQELHLMDQKQVKMLENQVKELKDDNKNKNDNKDIKKEPPTHKSWWQFWK